MARPAPAARWRTDGYCRAAAVAHSGGHLAAADVAGAGVQVVAADVAGENTLVLESSMDLWSLGIIACEVGASLQGVATIA